MKKIQNEKAETQEIEENQYDRQSFLGRDAQKIISRTIVGIIGLGGGGSHLTQQLAHIGFQNYRVFDPDIFAKTNFNRLVGAVDQDIKNEPAKIDIALRTIKKIQPSADVKVFGTKWQEAAEGFRGCDIVFGCVDGYAQRRELEVSARRYLIPLIDIGMDVYEYEKDSFSMSGQVILSLPDYACMTCLGFLTEDRFAREAALYGAAGSNPQVIWANGVLASTAVGVAVQLLTGWSKTDPPLYLTYDGNRGTVKPHPVMNFLPAKCPHFNSENVGDPVFKSL